MGEKRGFSAKNGILHAMLTIPFFVVQLLSIIAALIFIHEYKRINHKHEALMDAIDPGSVPSSTIQSTIIIWIYIILTIVMFLGTSALFLHSIS